MNESTKSVLLAGIDEVVKGFSGEVGLAAQNLNTGEQILINENTVYPTASSAKIWVLVEVFKQAEQGKISLEARIPLREKDRVLGSGILRDIECGVELAIRDLATVMITVSDNTATNMLIDLLGIENVRRTMQELGLKKSRLNNRIDFDLLANDAKAFGEASPADFARLMGLIAKREILAPASCDEIVRIMSRDQHMDFAPRWLPYNPYALELKVKQDTLVANKPGAILGVRTDVMLVRNPNAEYVVALMTNGCQDERWNADNEANLAIARISRLVFDYFTRESR